MFIILFHIVLNITVIVNAENHKINSTDIINTRLLLAEHPKERNAAFDELTVKYNEVANALLDTLDVAKTLYATDHSYHSPLHISILATEAWSIARADEALLSIVDYELDIASMPLGMDVPGYYFFPAAKALVHLRVDVSKIKKAIVAASNLNSLRILTWIMFERERDIEKAKMALSDASGKRHGATEIQNINIALELLENPSNLLPVPPKGDLPTSQYLYDDSRRRGRNNKGGDNDGVSIRDTTNFNYNFN
jgi:hypothetical protein